MGNPQVNHCTIVEEQHSAAVNDLNSCLKALDELPGEIETNIPSQISDQQNRVSQADSKVSIAEGKLRAARTDVQLTCIMGKSHYSPPFCTPMDQSVEMYIKCTECKSAHNRESKAQIALKKAKTRLTRAHSDLEALKSKLREAQQQLQKCEETTPALTEAKKAMDDKWLPQKEDCLAGHEDYIAKKRSFIPVCARDKYEDSCEKACLERQLNGLGGCGVVEGNYHGEAHVRGGIAFHCAPPQPSWIMGPQPYAQRESMSKQCDRILAVQQPQYAQRISKAGWLWKKGRVLHGWHKHFAVLESSDAVRSAVLRFYEDDPSNNQNVSASAPSLILWDAKGVKAKEAKKYGFKKGESCFKLYHFYADYRFCVPGDEATGQASPERERADWMQLLNSSMIYSDWK